MKKKFSFFALLFFSTTMYSQTIEVGVFLGGSNFIGDVGSVSYISPNEPAYGILYKYNKSPRHAYRISYIQSRISSNDRDSKDPSRIQRGYSFENNIKEVSLGLEFNFFDFNLHDSERKITPYIFSGINFANYNGLFFLGGITKYNATHQSLAVPMTVGIKSNVMPSVIVALEVGVRYTFADDLDGNNPKNESLTKLEFGNINNNDWYVFSGLTLTYTFGEKPCYCIE